MVFASRQVAQLPRKTDGDHEAVMYSCSPLSRRSALSLYLPIQVVLITMVKHVNMIRAESLSHVS